MQCLLLIVNALFQDFRYGIRRLCRAPSNPLALVPIVREQVRALASGQPATSFRTMQGYLDQSMAQPRSRSVLLGAFAGVALLLASVGIYGVISSNVAQRTHELGIRMALGARRRDVMRLVLQQGLVLALIGVCVGLIGSLIGTRIIESQLFGIEALDSVTFVGVSALLTCIALLACAMPALRAVRISPTEALRFELS